MYEKRASVVPTAHISGSAIDALAKVTRHTMMALKGDTPQDCLAAHHSVTTCCTPQQGGSSRWLLCMYV
jgi:hypothetical protein